MRLGFAIFFLGWSISAWTQQLTHYTQQPFLQAFVNPAFSGNARCIEMKSVHRAQWIGFDGAPKSTGALVSGRLGRRSKRIIGVFHGFSLRFENDRIGPFEHNRFHGGYAVHFPFSNEHYLSFGSFVGFDNFSFDNNNLNPIQSDPLLQQSRNSILVPDISFGGKYNSENFFIGLSFLNMIPTNYPIGTLSKKRFHSNFSTGAHVNFPKSDWGISPMLNLRIAAATPIAIDLYTMMDLRQEFYLGFGWRNQESILFLARFKVWHYFKVGYSFDWVYSPLKGGMGHTHEISLNISACKPVKRGATICPVFE